VFYGHERIPAAGEAVHGGMVKLQRLQERFPNSVQRFNLLYLVSSRLPEGAVGLARLARARGARLVLNQNGVASPAWPGPGWEEVNEPLAQLVHRADHVFYQSEFCREAADRFLGPRRGPCEVLYNAVDTSVFTPAAGNPDSQGLTLLLGGSQDHRYRLVAALETVSRLRRQGHAIRLLVTGRFRWGGDEAAATAEASQLVSDLQLSPHVSFLGPYPQSEAPGLLRKAHLLLHTQYNDACPGLVVEALSCGLPVVYSKSGGVPELVGDEAGIGIPVARTFETHIAPDPDALAEAVATVARDLPRFSGAARLRAVARFDLQPWLQRHREVFEAQLR
jgi:glycosyltransferase involved in cell wall biosynthesis